MKTAKEWIASKTSLVNKNVITKRFTADDISAIQLDACSSVVNERVAELQAHRAVGNQEQDVTNGKLAGYCIVCQVPWPCSFAKSKLTTH